MTPAVSEVPARILVVDDDEAAAHTLGRLLRQEGYDVRVAVSGQAGLQESESSPPDAIILDLRMPAMDGLEFLRRLRHKENQRGTPVAVVTGDYFLDETMLAELQQLRATLRFKPLWLDDLAGLARDLLRVTS
jgi:two-component system OmpR family response regulator